MKILLFLAGCLFFTACASAPQLSKEGSYVKLVDALPKSEADAYDKINPIACENSATKNADENRTRCRTELRNHGAMMGGDVVVIDGQEVGTPGCETCVRMNGFVYKSK
jgi:hypothetical protein